MRIITLLPSILFFAISTAGGAKDFEGHRMRSSNFPKSVSVLTVLLSVLTFGSAFSESETLDTESFRTELEKIQALSDEQGKRQEALDGFVAMRGRLKEGVNSSEYEVGLEMSILWTARRLGDKDLLASTFHFKAKKAFVKAEQDYKIKAEQIHLG